MRSTMVYVTTALLLGGCFEDPDPVPSTGSSGSDTTATSSPSTGSTSMVDSSTTDPTAADSTTVDGSTTVEATTAVDSTSTSDSGMSMPAQVLFINFDAITLTGGPQDDAPNNTVLEGWEGRYEAHPRPSEIDTIVAGVQEHWAPFNVLVTGLRPMVAPYTMVVVTPSSPFPDFIFGSATEVDCDNENPNNVAFVYTQTDVAPEFVANVISGEVGRTLGLAYQLVDDTDVMALPYQSAPRSFVDDCLMYDADPDPANNCVDQHVAQFCPDGTQNSYGEVETMFGPA